MLPDVKEFIKQYRLGLGSHVELKVFSRIKRCLLGAPHWLESSLWFWLRWTSHSSIFSEHHPFLIWVMIPLYNLTVAEGDTDFWKRGWNPNGARWADDITFSPNQEQSSAANQDISDVLIKTKVTEQTSERSERPKTAASCFSDSETWRVFITAKFMMSLSLWVWANQKLISVMMSLQRKLMNDDKTYTPTRCKDGRRYWTFLTAGRNRKLTRFLLPSTREPAAIPTVSWSLRTIHRRPEL